MSAYLVATLIETIYRPSGRVITRRTRLAEGAKPPTQDGEFRLDVKEALVRLNIKLPGEDFRAFIQGMPLELEDVTLQLALTTVQ